MSDKYESKTPRCDDEYYEDEVCLLGDVVYEKEKSTFSGLYDDRGNELHRIKKPIGFMR